MKETVENSNFKGQGAHLDPPRKKHNTFNPASKVYSRTGMRNDRSVGS